MRADPRPGYEAARGLLRARLPRAKIDSGVEAASEHEGAASDRAGARADNR
jgi:hypothetical protein